MIRPAPLIPAQPSLRMQPVFAREAGPASSARARPLGSADVWARARVSLTGGTAIAVRRLRPGLSPVSEPDSIAAAVSFAKSSLPRLFKASRTCVPRIPSRAASFALAACAQVITWSPSAAFVFSAGREDLVASSPLQWVSSSGRVTTRIVAMPASRSLPRLRRGALLDNRPRGPMSTPS